MLVDLQIPTWEAWQAKYRDDIRVKVWWDELQRPKPKIERVYSPRDLWYPWYPGERQEWRSGKVPVPVATTLRTGHSLVVAPAVRVPNHGYLLLDGCHRIRDLRPVFLALDALIVTTKQLRSFADLLGGWHE